jgi:hypothetical protein
MTVAGVLRFVAAHWLLRLLASIGAKRTGDGLAAEGSLQMS